MFLADHTDPVSLHLTKARPVASQAFYILGSPDLSPSSPTFVFFFFAIIVILTGTNRYLIMILVCISLVINGVKTSFHVFVGYLYFSFGEIFIQVFCPFLICLCVIELLDTRFLSDMIASIFSNLLSLSLS